MSADQLTRYSRLLGIAFWPPLCSIRCNHLKFRWSKKNGYRSQPIKIFLTGDVICYLQKTGTCKKDFFIFKWLALRYWRIILVLQIQRKFLFVRRKFNLWWGHQKWFWLVRSQMFYKCTFICTYFSRSITDLRMDYRCKKCAFKKKKERRRILLIFIATYKFKLS